MWGWKSVERTVEPAVSFEEAKRLLVCEGFRIVMSHPHHVVLEGEGDENGWSTLAPDGQQLPIELAVGCSTNGLFLLLRYRTLVLFDTGDLNRFADRIQDFLRSTGSQPVSMEG